MGGSRAPAEQLGGGQQPPPAIAPRITSLPSPLSSSLPGSLRPACPGYSNQATAPGLFWHKATEVTPRQGRGLPAWQGERGGWSFTRLVGLPRHLPPPRRRGGDCSEALSSPPGVQFASAGFPPSLLTPKPFDTQTLSAALKSPVLPSEAAGPGMRGELLSVIQTSPSQPGRVQPSQAQPVTRHTPGQTHLQPGIMFADR